jgi:hypothetical protein
MALVALLVILSALTILSLGLIVFARTEIQIADNQRTHVGALYVAEAGVSEVVARMDLPVGTMVTANGYTFDASIRDDIVNPDPNWRTEVYLENLGGLPAPVGTEVIVPTVQSSADWLAYGDTDQGLDPIVVEHKWADRDGDGIRDANELVRYDANRFPPQNFDSGQPIEVITVSGLFGGSRRRVRSEIVRLPLSVRVTAAMTSDNVIDLTGNMSGCGHNHDIATPVGTRIPGCRPFELCANRTADVTAGCLVAVMTTGDIAATGGSSDLEGFPTWADTSSANNFFDIQDYLGISLNQWNEVRNNPDYTSSTDAVNMDGIVVVEGDATGPERWNGNVGTGLIYVNGDMDISGNLVWKGMIYVEGDCDITGTAWILGAIMVRGTTTATAFSAGNSVILYSRDAISLYVGGQMSYQTLAWNEF